VVNKNAGLRSPWFRPQSEQLCVILHYYTHTNAGRESITAEIRIEYPDSRANTVVEYLEPSEVSFILNTKFYLINLWRENNLKTLQGLQVLPGGKLYKRNNART